MLIGFSGQPFAGASGRAGDRIDMAALVDRPGLLLVVSFAGFLLAALLGVVAQRVWSPGKGGRSEPAHHRPNRRAVAARAHRRVQLLNGGQPLRPAKEPGGGRSQWQGSARQRSFVANRTMRDPFPAKMLLASEIHSHFRRHVLDGFASHVHQSFFHRPSEGERRLVVRHDWRAGVRADADAGRQAERQWDRYR
jgi:hypothetical protein